MFKLASLAALASATVLAALLAVNFLLTFVPSSFYVVRAKEAVASGALASRSGFPFIAGRPFRYDINDCLVLTMLGSSRPPSRLKATISPTIGNFPEAMHVPQIYRPVGVDVARSESPKVTEARGMRPGNECFLLRQTIDHAPATTSFYHRYIHGYLTLMGVLLIPLDYTSATGLIHSTALAIPLFLIFTILFTRRRNLAARDVSFVGVAAGYLIFSGASYFAWQIDIGPGEILLSAFLALFWRKPLIELSEHQLCIITAVFGSLALAFDFLRGLIPCALLLLLGILALDGGRDDRTRLRAAGIAIGSFCFAIVGLFAVKAILVAAIWGSAEVLAAAKQLALHTAVGTWAIDPHSVERLAPFGITPDMIRSSRLLTYFYALAKLVYFSDLVTFGLKPLGITVVAAGPALLTFFAIYRFAKPSPAISRSSALLLIAAVCFLATWFFVFIEHTITGAAFMQRVLAWPTILLVGIAAKAGFLRYAPVATIPTTSGTIGTEASRTRSGRN